MTKATLLPVPRPGILDIAPYVGGESKIPGVERVIKLASNEGALGPSPRALAAYHDAAATMYRYPDGNAVALRAALAHRFGLEADRILCGAGSDELITLLVRAYAGPGDEVLYSRHGFLIYPIAAQGVGATPVTAPETNLTTDVDALIAAVTPRTRIVFVANPNNPTGTYLSAAEMARLHAALPSDVILAIDSAYAEFVTPADYEPGIGLVRRADNVIMFRTFSKIFGMGGMRLGWAYCPAGIHDALNRLRCPFNVSAAAQYAGVAALEDIQFFETSRAHNARWLPWTADALKGLGIEVNPSVCNFVLARFSTEPGRDAAAAFDHLKRNGILVRKMGSYGLAEWLRISIGLETEMRATVAALASFIGKA